MKAWVVYAPVGVMNGAEPLFRRLINAASFAAMLLGTLRRRKKVLSI
jgi:predicted DNA-binding protein (UPF0278 family)